MCLVIEIIFMVVNNQKLNKYVAIWSHCSLLLTSTSISGIKTARKSPVEGSTIEFYPKDSLSELVLIYNWKA